MLHMYTEMGSVECIDIQLKFLDSQNPCTYTQSWSEQPAFYCRKQDSKRSEVWGIEAVAPALAQVVWPGPYRVPNISAVNMGPGCYDNHRRNLHQHLV